MNSSLIDLHVHTKFSDGSDDLVSILKKAEENNLEYLSITDHDNCYFYDELKKINISDYYSGKIIPGVELRTVINKIPIELLGYGVNTDYINAKCKELYISYKEKDEIETKRLFNNFKEIGVDVAEDVLETYDNSFRYGSSYLFSEMKKNIKNKRFITDERIWEDDTLFYRRCMSNPESPFYVKSDDFIPSCDRVISLIKDAGGLVFIPHIFIYGKDSLNILDVLVNNYDIDGIECHYSHFKKEQTEYLVDFCNNNNLYISGGSDYHGMRKKELSLAKGKGNLNISNNILSDWIDKINLI